MTDKIPDATRPAPDTSKPSREFDLWIAEHIAGWQWWVSSSSGRRCLFAPDKQPSWFTAVAKGDEPLVNDFEYVTQDVPNYSENRAAAFELAWSFDHSYIHKTTDDNAVYVELCNEGQKEATADGKQEAFALIVCQAAIEATKVK